MGYWCGVSLDAGFDDEARRQAEGDQYAAARGCEFHAE
jgi:hypothetical protein